MVLEKNIEIEPTSELLSWYYLNKRDLPWRETSDPWLILLSEIILQQTQVSRGLQYWIRISTRFPTPKAMATSDVEELLSLWQGAGYYARARRLHALSVLVSKRKSDGGYDGEIPSSVDELLKLPGIGPYTASAIASIAFGVPSPVVDGNVKRVSSRILAIESPSTNTLRTWAGSMLDPKRAGDSNQALMELGAIVCRPKSPKCELCPMTRWCLGIENPESYPSKKKTRRLTEELDAAVLIDPYGRPFLTKREDNGRFGGMWGPPMNDIDTTSMLNVGKITHELSHRKLIVSVWTGDCATGTDPKTVPISNLDRKILDMAFAI